MKKIANNFSKLIVALIIINVVLITGCSMGTSKEARLDAFITEMESGPTANPRSHFAGNANASKIDSGTFNSTNMAPNDNLDITGYVITGDTFTMTYTTDALGNETVTTASFYMEKSSTGGEDWFIRSMTVPVGVGAILIPDSL